ncbi:hypothetical protein HZA44_04385 [Candidatus Peregrinibacteria bacterium]|nr:hypothetical protein [Candidatus Peregrinibacteria bacterium]
MSEPVENNSIVLKEKSIEGDGDHVLRLIQVEGEKNNLRLCLSVRGLVSCAVFGGAIAFEIKPDEVLKTFDQITTADQFYERSERIRKAVIDVLKG